MFSKTFLPLLLLALSITSPVSSAAVRRSKCKPPGAGIYKAVDGGSNIYPDISKLAGSVEGASVDANGIIYAVDNQTFTSLRPTKPAFAPLSFAGKEKVFLAASRHTRTLGTLVGNAGGKVIYTTKGDGKYEVFVESEDLVQPNDFTIDADEKRIFYSAQKYQATSVKGEDGAVGCIDTKTKKITKVPTEVLTAAGTYRINGIDLSPDDKYLYVTSQRNQEEPIPDKTEKATVSTEQKVFRFKVPKEGCDLGKPKEWADLTSLLARHGIVDAKKAMDPDGLRTDNKGRVYVALNAFGRVIKIHSPKKSEIIETPNIANPSNLEFGMEKGDHLVIVGRCSGDNTSDAFNKACVAYLGVDASGRAFTNLNKGKNGPKGGKNDY